MRQKFSYEGGRGDWCGSEPVGEIGLECLVCLLQVVRGGRGESVGAAVGTVVSGFRMAKEFE